jgi:hypothetical protein
LTREAPANQDVKAIPTGTNAALHRVMSALSFLLIAGFVLLATGCGRANAQQVPGDAGIHIADALRRDMITRDATPLHLDGGGK